MRTERGSALLVVLGMLAFMVVSGVAFSAYMRATRMPSSFTRRTATTRQLAKAALAEAIDQIDRAIANDPHPNVRLNNSNDNNFWVGRVLVTSDTTAGSSKKPREVAAEMESDTGCEYTVPVLSLEALAYLPPTLVNEARYYGQLTPSAAWQSLPFDAGRYAFVALDVSDYFDVNRVLADEARSSHPARRVNVAHLFEGGGEDHASAPTGAKTWEDSFMSHYRNVADDGTISFNSEPPFVSIADFNLALGAGFGNFASPLYRYLRNSGGTGFYNATPGGALWDAYSRMTFVTDSLQAHEDHTDGTDTFDLDTDDGQPYSDSFLNQSLTARSASSILDDCTSRKPWELFKNRLSACGMIALCDYLDKDDVPTSLALPTTERVPMVCGVRPMPNQLKVVISREFSSQTVNTVPQVSQDVEMTVTYRYKLEGEVNVDAWTAFPFRDRTGFKDDYAADCRVAMFLSSEEMGLRTSDPRVSGDLLRAPTLSSNGLKDGIVNLIKTGKACPTKTISQPADAVRQTDGFDFEDASTVFTGNDKKGVLLFSATFVCKQTWDSNNNVWTPTPNAQNSTLKDSPKCEFSPLLATGAADASFASTIKGNTKGTSIVGLKLPATKLRFNLATWISVHNSDGKIVDLVPACMSDDNVYNGMSYDDNFTDGVFEKVAGKIAPLLKFSESGTTAEINIFDKNDFLKTSSSQVHGVTLAQKEGLVIRDPRYNYAPENWFAAASTINEQYWIDNTGCADSGCDGDIFMATSDQERMQSVAEVAFVPRFTDLNSVPSDQDVGNRIKDPETAWTGKDYPAKGSEAQADMMWRTFNPFDDGSNADGFVDLQEIFHHHGKGVRVNPYSDSTNVIMAAFANTPVSWRVASDNEDTTVNPAADKQTDVAAFNRKYAWNAYGPSEYQISWADLTDVAGQFMAEVRASAQDGRSWETALQDLFTDCRTDDEKKLCGIELEKSGRFYSVDKKTLWGFWQDSFEASQQLFLVFFRAEPMMLGGGIAGVTPPQLGAKGVAVVWRDPNKTNGINNNNNAGQTGYVPHRTRILFYRQFE